MARYNTVATKDSSNAQSVAAMFMKGGKVAKIYEINFSAQQANVDVPQVHMARIADTSWGSATTITPQSPLDPSDDIFALGTTVQHLIQSDGTFLPGYLLRVALNARATFLWEAEEESELVVTPTITGLVLGLDTPDTAIYDYELSWWED